MHVNEIVVELAGGDCLLQGVGDDDGPDVLLPQGLGEVFVPLGGANKRERGKVFVARRGSLGAKRFDVAV